MMKDTIVLSAMPKTWILDLDGTLVKHNGYKIDGFDTLLNDAKLILENIKEDDLVIIVTSREEKYRCITEAFLHENRIRYNYILFEAPYGERIVINDDKPSGLQMAHSITCIRDSSIKKQIIIDDRL